ncbi:MAG: fatty acid desaturase [Sulfitobacter sp.]
MDHTQFIASLSAKEKQRLHQRSNRRGLRHLAVHVAILGAMAFYIAAQGPFWGVMMIPYGITLMFLFTLSHECTHATAFRTPKINDLIGQLVSLPLLLPFTWFRYFHLAHHKWTNDPENDPELIDGGRPTTWRAYLWYLSGWGYWHGNASTLWQNAFGTISAPYLPPRKHALMRREARILLTLYVILLASLIISPLGFWLWLCPALIGQPFLRLYLLAEHGHCPQVANMLENTRTTFTNRLIRFVAWNMPYHAEHHAMPMVPFHALPKLHAKIKSHLKSTSPGYRDFSCTYISALKNSPPRNAKSKM